ncbi:MAG: carboxypeptidase regulatory-like domain-containing protein [Chloroflexi bacterium]|nr:carboxypeptidase regulatory-like domain-containing protein [Chloroflexota bacterium]
MSLEDSPTLEDFSDDFLSPPPEKADKKRRFSAILIGLALLIVILVGINFAQSGAYDQLAGNGSLSGHAVNESGEAIAVEIFVFGTEISVISADDGYFEIENVPAGERSIIIAYGDIATEEITLINAGEKTDLGSVTVPTEMETDY